MSRPYVEPLESDKPALGDWHPDSIGGQAILSGRRAYDAGKPRPPYVWPFLYARGWHGRKGELQET